MKLPVFLQVNKIIKLRNVNELLTVAVGFKCSRVIRCSFLSHSAHRFSDPLAFMCAAVRKTYCTRNAGAISKQCGVATLKRVEDVRLCFHLNPTADQVFLFFL